VSLTDADLRGLAENAPDVIARFDREHRHLYVNRTVERLTGLSVSSFIGKTNEELGMPPELTRQWDAAMERVFETGEEIAIEFELEVPQGLRIFSSRLVPERREGGRVVTVIAATRDITDSKMVVEARRMAEEQKLLAEAGARLAEENARLFAAERAARQQAEAFASRTSQLQQLSRALADSLSPEGAAKEVAVAVKHAIGAGAVIVWFVDPNVDDVILAAAEGYDGPSLDPYHRFSLAAPLPVCDAVRERRPIFLASSRERVERYPTLGDGRDDGFQSWVAVPLLVEQRVVGVFALSFREERSFSDDDRALLVAMGAQSAQVIERTRLFLAERRARAASEASEAELRRRERRYLSLVRASAQIVWVTTAEGMVVEDSPSWYAFTGQTYDEWKGLGWINAVHPEDRPNVEQRWIDAVLSKALFEVEFRLRRADGSYTPVLSRAAPVFDEDGSVLEWIGTSTDITKRRQAEERLKAESHINETLYRLGASFAKELEQDRLVQLITDEATALTGADYGAFFFNATGNDGQTYQLYTIAGAAKDSFAGFPVPRATPLFAPTFQGKGVVRFDDVRKDPRFGLWGSQPAGHPVVASYLAAPVVSRSGEVIGGLFFGHAEAGRFSEQHERVVTGLAAQAAVALENARLYAALRESEAKARTAERRKDEFLALLGHELRNPLAPIVTALGLMRRKGKESDRERQVIERQVEHLSRLVDDLLDVARITRGKIELKREPIESAVVVAKAIEMASPLLERRRHALTVSVPREGLLVMGDAMRLAQVLSNLLTNAAKYTEAGGRIELSAEGAEGQVIFRVKDNGMGISAELLPRIFDLFIQGDRTFDRAEGGLGLGLTLVRSLVNLHDGVVKALSAGPGQGSEFIVRLPMIIRSADGASDEQSPPVRASSPSGVRRILIVDDNTDAAETLAELLQVDGHDLRVAHDGPRALTIAEQFRPEIALLDIGLPVMDGYELAGKLRSLLGDEPLRLIAVTGYGQESDRLRARDAGFHEHLVKPIDIDRVNALIAAPLPVD
jgi:PAS domain S-box-containing protein